MNPLYRCYEPSTGYATTLRAERPGVAAEECCRRSDIYRISMSNRHKVYPRTVVVAEISLGKIGEPTEIIVQLEPDAEGTAAREVG